MKIYTLLVLLLAISVIANAQKAFYDVTSSDEGFYQNTDTDSTQFEEMENINLFGGNPESVGQKSLRAYLPLPINLMDGKTPPSAAIMWAFTYQAMGIQYQIQYKQKLTFSYSYIHNLMAKSNDCKFTGNSINQLTSILKSQGTVLANAYSQQPTCGIEKFPTIKAEHYKITNSGFLFNTFCNDQSAGCLQGRKNDNKINLIKTALASNKPVIVVLKVGDDFHLLRSEFIQYNMSKPIEKSKTIVIIGYDDQKQAFEVTFPGGQNWGNNGIAYLKYHDLIYATRAIVLYISKPIPVAKQENNVQPKTKIEIVKTDKPPVSPKPSTVPNPKPVSPNSIQTPSNNLSSLTASVQLRNVFLNSAKQLITNPLTLNYNGTVFELNDKLSDTQRYQLFINELKEDTYLYVLNIEENNKQVHFPINKAVGAKTLTERPLSSYVISSKAAFYVPQPRFDTTTNALIPRGFVKDKPEKEYMVLLFSKFNIDNDIQPLLAKLSYTTDSRVFYSQLVAELGDRVANPSKISQYNDGFVLQAENPKGFILPVVITINGK